MPLLAVLFRQIALSLGLATSPIAFPSIGTPLTVPCTPTSSTISSIQINHSSPPTAVVV